MLKEWFKNLNKKEIAKEAVVGTGSAIGRIIGLALKINLDKPQHARKVGNEW